MKDPSWTRAEKAAFAIAFSNNAKQGLPLLLGAMKPITTMAQDRYPVHQAILFGLTRLGTRDCKECIDKLTNQVAKDEKAVRLPGARDLLGETRVAEAIIENQGASDVVAANTAVGGGGGDARAGGEGEQGRRRRARPRAGRRSTAEADRPAKRGNSELSSRSVDCRDGRTINIGRQQEHPI